MSIFSRSVFTCQLGIFRFSRDYSHFKVLQDVTTVAALSVIYHRRHVTRR